MVLHRQRSRAALGDVNVEVPNQCVPVVSVGMAAVKERIVDVVFVFLVRAVEKIPGLIEIHIAGVAGPRLRQLHPKLFNALVVHPNQRVEEADSAAEGVGQVMSVG